MKSPSSNYRRLPNESDCYAGDSVSSNRSNTELKMVINIGKQLLIELEKITANMESDQVEEAKRNEWKFVAMVMDQFCFYMFTFSCLVSLMFTLGQAPGLQVEW